jgi:hypothetical protein
MTPEDILPDSDAAEAEAADAYFQAGFDAGSDGLRWVRAALSVLTAEVPEPPAKSLEERELAAARTEASRAIARLFRGIAADRPA